MANLSEKKDTTNFLNSDGTYNRGEWNNGTNQNIKGRFVEREIYVNLNLFVEDSIKAHQLNNDLGFDYYEYIKYFYTASDGEEYTQDQANEKIEELEEEIQELNSTIIYLEDEGHETADEEKQLSELEELKAELENADFEELYEPYEYWSVSGWLGKKLEEKGEIIIDEMGHCIWGRCTTGQAILLDSVISEICEDLEILQGQKSDWSKQ